MRTINTDIIEKILFLNNKILNFGQREIFNNKNLTPIQFNLLGEIILNKKISISKLKKSLIISLPSLSQIINRMEKAGLVKRKLGKEDKRNIYLSATTSGINLYNEINQKYIKLSDQKMSLIDKKDKEHLFKLLGEIEKIFD